MQEQTIHEIESTKMAVKRMLENNELARNSDKGCQFLIWKEMCAELGYHFDLPFKIFTLLPSAATINRTKRYIQNTLKECVPNEEVQERLKIREKEFRRYYGIH